MKRKVFYFLLVGISFCVVMTLIRKGRWFDFPQIACQEGTSDWKVTPRSERWGEWDDLYGRLQQDADISSGTFYEIKTLLKEKKNREGISNYAVGHTEAFERGGLLLVLSWDGNPEGNVYDVRARLFKRDSELCGMAWVDDSGCLLAVDNLREPSARYTKISDRIVCFVSSCVGYYDANGVWLRVEYMDRGRSILKLF